MKKLFIKVILVGILFFTNIIAFAETTINPAKPEQVIFGVYPISIYNLDPLNNSFDISFYAWWRSKGKTHDLTKDLEIVNAHDYSFKYADNGKTNIGNNYTFAHYYAKIHQQWNPKYFPFSRQILKVQMEAFSDNKIINFIPDLENSHLHSDFNVPGWDVIGFKVNKSVSQYTTDFGNSDAPNSFYDRLTFTVEIKHRGMRSFFSYYLGFIMAGILAHILYLMTPFPYPARATIFTGAIFSFVGNKYILDQRLPITSVFTLADTIQAATFIIVFISILVSVISELTIPKDELRKRNISWAIGAVSLSCYITCIAWYTYLAVIS